MGGSKKKKTERAGKGSEASGMLKVCGPSLIETLCGNLLGREVALICCGEAHEEAIDLTRAKSVTDAEEGWSVISSGDGGFDPSEAVAEQKGLTLNGAKAWAERILTKLAEDSDESSDSEGETTDDGYLVFEVEPGSLSRPSKAKGVARVYSSDAERSLEFPLAAEAVVLEWGDLDEEARCFNKRRLRGERVPTEEHDELIDRRKKKRLAEGIEYLDDWLLRQAASDEVHVRVLLESAIHPEELELHADGDFGPAPVAHDCIRRIELDSDADSDDSNDPDDGTGCYADYFLRRVSAALPRERVRGTDPRDIGDNPDEHLRAVFRTLEGVDALPADEEEVLLERLGAEPAATDADDADDDQPTWKELRAARLPPVPSWEAYFGAAAELLYYAPEIKADYAPFIACCVEGPRELFQFFDALYFSTVPEALALVNLGSETRALAQIRSLAFQSGDSKAPLLRRPSMQSKIPVRAPPLNAYLKACGSNPPRTWVSGLASRVRDAGCSDVVEAAQKWYRETVRYLLEDPKAADEDGDYFAAWLRACHREIWDDIDRSDPQELLGQQWVASRKHPRSKKHRHKLGDITIPGLEAAFKELKLLDPACQKAATARQRVLAKILVDAFQLRLVDLAMILAVADAVAASPPDVPVAVVLYAGEDHTSKVGSFWKGWGFRAPPKAIAVGKSDWDDEEPRALEFPSYLQDLRKLFPIS